MKAYDAKDIRNVAVAGHGSRGKTTLAEAMLYTAKATDRLGRVDEGTTVLDFDPEEKKRKATVSTSLACIEWKDTKINILDTPGLFDFAGGVSEGIRAAGSVLIVTGAGCEYDVGAEKALKAADDRGIAKMFAITRCDAENADFYKTFHAIKDAVGGAICPVIVPFMKDGKVDSYVNLASRKAFKYENGNATQVDMPEDSSIDEMLDILTEAVACSDEDMMDKYFNGESFTVKEIIKALNDGVNDGSVIPVYACSGYNLEAIDLLLDEIVYSVPSAADKAGEAGLKCDNDGHLAAICFKTISDPFVGKMSFVKVISGKITADMSVYNPRTEATHRMGKMITLKGQKQYDADCIPAGDIGVITKLSGIRTGDTICSAKYPVELEGVKFPTPCISMAVKVDNKDDEEKAAAGITKICIEDPTISFEINKETREQVISGLGEQHLDVVVSKLKNKFGVDVKLTVPKVAYRESIRKRVEVQGRHKKQSGGHGQFGDVWIRFEPCGEDDLVFAEEVVGGSVPKNFFPAVEKGLRDSVKKGVLAGYPMVGVKATLYDGSYHPVDSSEMAFKTAAHLAYKNGIPQANPVILEPIGSLKVYMPDEKLGDVMGDVTKRRGRVLGMGAAEEDKYQILEAEVPMGEMGNFATVLRSITAGRGHFTLDFVRYEEAPAPVAQKVIEDAKANEAEEK